MNSDMTLTITQPDDWHLHVRDGDMLKLVVPHTAAVFKRAIIMPNLKPPITNAAMANAYKKRIVAAAGNQDFTPLMTLYLTDETTPNIISEAKEAGVIAAKLYPAGATTNSAAGVIDVKKIYQSLEAMQQLNMPLLVHGEVTGDVDIFDREAMYIDNILIPLVKNFPALKIVRDHITPQQAAEYVSQAGENIGATITPQHLLYNRNAILSGGIRPHYYCLPILKREQHRQALLALVGSDCNRVFLGTDSAPHSQHAKESDCGCAGCYSAYHAMPLYLEAFESVNALDKFEAFASFNGPDFYGLPRNTSKIQLQKKSWTLPESFGDAADPLVPLKAGETLQWQVKNSKEAK
jgi:dihydroorotase